MKRQPCVTVSSSFLCSWRRTKAGWSEWLRNKCEQHCPHDTFAILSARLLWKLPQQLSQQWTLHCRFAYATHERRARCPLNSLHRVMVTITVEPRTASAAVFALFLFCGDLDGYIGFRAQINMPGLNTMPCVTVSKLSTSCTRTPLWATISKHTHPAQSEFKIPVFWNQRKVLFQNGNELKVQIPQKNATHKLNSPWKPSQKLNYSNNTNSKVWFQREHQVQYPIPTRNPSTKFNFKKEINWHV